MAFSEEKWPKMDLFMAFSHEIDVRKAVSHTSHSAMIDVNIFRGWWISGSYGLIGDPGGRATVASPLGAMPTAQRSMGPGSFA